MPTNDNIRVVHLTVRLAANPKFEVRADERVKSLAGDAESSRSAVGAEAVSLLREVLRKIDAAYGEQDRISLNISGNRILSDQGD